MTLTQTQSIVVCTVTQSGTYKQSKSAIVVHDRICTLIYSLLTGNICGDIDGAADCGQEPSPGHKSIRAELDGDGGGGDWSGYGGAVERLGGGSVKNLNLVIIASR